MPIAFDQFRLLDAKQELKNALHLGHPAPWQGQANSFRCPLGPAPGRGWILLLRRDIDALDKDALHTLTFDDCQGGRITLRDLLFVRAKCLTPGQTGAREAAYLVEVADVRWLAANPYFSTPCNKQYNVRVPSAAQTYYDGSLNGSAAWDWHTMTGDLWTAVNVPELGTAPALPFGNTTCSQNITAGANIVLTLASIAGIEVGDLLAIDDGTLLEVVPVTAVTPPNQITVSLNNNHNGTSTPFKVRGPGALPEGWQFIGVSAWEAYHQVLERLGCAFALDPTRTRTPRVFRRGKADSALAPAEARYRDRLLVDDELIEGTRAKVPSKVRVVFHIDHEHYGTEQTTRPTTVNPATDAVHVIDVLDPDATTGVQPDSVALLYDDLPALLSYLGSISNSSALQARADERAADFYRQLRSGGALKHKTYSGIINDAAFLPGNRLAGVAWYDFGDGLKTEIVHHPPSVRVDDRGQWCGPEGPSEHLQPPDLGRKSFPLYPPLTQLVKVEGTSATTDIYDGSVQRFDPRGSAYDDTKFSVLEDCWVRPTPTSPAPANNTYYVGRLNGVATIGGTTRPLYVVGNVNAGGGGGGLTVREVDTIATVTSVTTLEFNQDDGYVVSGAGGVARIDRPYLFLRSNASPALPTEAAQNFDTRRISRLSSFGGGFHNPGDNASELLITNRVGGPADVGIFGILSVVGAASLLTIGCFLPSTRVQHHLGVTLGTTAVLSCGAPLDNPNDLFAALGYAARFQGNVVVRDRLASTLFVAIGINGIELGGITGDFGGLSFVAGILVGTVVGQQTGILPVTGGGTGAGSFTIGGVLFGNAVDEIQATSPGAPRTFLAGNGPGNAPTFRSIQVQDLPIALMAIQRSWMGL